MAGRIPVFAARTRGASVKISATGSLWHWLPDAGNPGLPGFRGADGFAMRLGLGIIVVASGLCSLAGAARAEVYPSTYSPLPSEPTLIVNATILTGAGERIENASLLMSDGRIREILRGADYDISGDYRIIDAQDRWVTPGLIDVHSHLGVSSSPGVKAHSDTNEATDPSTAQVWAEHSIWPQDPGFSRALPAV